MNSSKTKYQISDIPPLVVIVGPTASGKSSIAMEIARIYNGEIICADSRTIYKGMDIGTAKPSEADRAEIAHHMLDVVNPGQPFSAAEFKRRALIWIDDISIRGKLPIMVGGTGLYVDSVLFDYAFLPPGSQEEREQLQSLSVEQLQEKLKSMDVPLPENSRNPRHLIRAIETNGAVPVKKGIRSNTLIIGIDRGKEELTGSINQRVQAMLAVGLGAEVKDLADKYGWESPGMQSVGYREWRYLDSIEDVQSEIEKNTLRYAKRQRTWFKRNPHIVWVKNVAEAKQQAKKFLQN